MRILPISRKLFAAVLTAALLAVVGYLYNRLAPGTPVPPEVEAFVPLAVGAISGWAVKEVPGIVAAKGGFDNAGLESKLEDEAENDKAPVG